MKRLLYALTIAATVGMLWGSVTTAQGCSCAVEPFERQVAIAQVFVVGQVSELRVVPAQPELAQQSTREVHAIFRVQEYVKGTGPATLELWAYGLRDDDLTGITAVGVVCQLFGNASGGRRYVLYFAEQSRLDEDPGSCGGSFELDAPERGQKLERARELVAAALPPSGGPPSSATFPALPAAALAVLGPLAFLAGAAFVWRRGEPHTG